MKISRILLVIALALLAMPATRAAGCLRRPHDNQILPVPADFPLPEIEIYLYWHRSAEGDPANRWLREQLHKVFAVPAVLTPARKKRPRACG